MRLTSIPLSLLLTTALLAGCDKIDFGDDSGITERTGTNAANGQVDDSDWKLDDHWESREKDLFKDVPVGLNGTTSPLVVNQTFAFYPNPVRQFASFGYRFDLASQEGVRTRIRYVVVDRKYNVIQEGNISSATTNWDQERFSVFSVPFTDEKFKKGKTYRMYYVLYEPDKVIFLGKGHGDIEIAD